tara:strand:+ start:42270 stop:42902 length:633 start_codon:yes stop_codon:yes gene_type:complete
MTIMPNSFFVTLALGISMLITGCTTQQPSPLTAYDLGSVSQANDAPLQARLKSLNLPTIGLAEVTTPAWLDSQQMMYRLSYGNDQQTHAYASNRWSMSPAQLFQQRLTARLSQAGAGIVSASDGALNVPVLHVALDDFSQVFTSVSQNHARATVRASLYDGRNLIAQKMFNVSTPSTSADAQGGARALSEASDAIIDNIAVWLSKYPPKK